MDTSQYLWVGLSSGAFQVVSERFQGVSGVFLEVLAALQVVSEGPRGFHGGFNGSRGFQEFQRGPEGLRGSLRGSF